MISKRVKQFYTNVTDFMSEEDYKYVKSILNDIEFDLFRKLLKSEQKHSVRIAREIEYIINHELTDNNDIRINKNILVKSTLLHDIVKIRKKINVIDKSIIVILNKLTKSNLRKFRKSAKIQCYYNHSEYSYEILKELTEDELLLYIVKNHHSNMEDEMIKFFQEIDDRN